LPFKCNLQRYTKEEAKAAFKELLADKGATSTMVGLYKFANPVDP
jgi:hypothetical protein